MNQKLFSGLTAALLVSTLGLAPSGYADQSKSQSVDEQSGVRVPESGTAVQVGSASASEETAGSSISSQETQLLSRAATATAASAAELIPSSEEKVFTPPNSSNPVVATSTPTTPNSTSPRPDDGPSVEAVKVGEYQSQEASRVNTTIATIQPHQLRGRDAVTLYVRNIPVLTFLEGTSTRTTAPTATVDSSEGATVKVASIQSSSGTAATQTDPVVNPSGPAVSDVVINAADSQDPVWRATTVAARLNQLHRDNIKADDIKVSWNADHQEYVIKANDTQIVAVNDNTVLPDTVGNSANDVLQATNRIRRQMGGASPLSGIEGDPNGFRQVSLGNLNLRVSGYASWYGPGFDGNYSASGEIFNQDALTAAHPSLPFGTQVRVTNMDNGQSVVVRIIDRGPYAHGRIIDLSTGAARVIGLISSGVAPVSLEVLGATRTALN